MIKKKSNGKRWLAMFLAGVICFGAVQSVPLTAEAKEPVKIVIDPGHGGWGGTNEGGKFGTNVEKYVTMLTAQAMKQTLEQFEGVEVYLTRTEDTEISLEQRAETAKAYGADFMFSIHYNMSADHSLYGTEVWTSAFGSYYSKGQTFANIHLAAMQENYGLYNRGAKVRLNSRGTDYYGIIRASRAKSIACVIIEHCYFDHPNDNYLVTSQEQMVSFGVTDALSVAKYYRLKSPSLGLDFSGFDYTAQPAPAGGKAFPDETPPTGVSAVTGRPDANGFAQVTLSAADAESRILYYSYSMDGGLTWTGLQKWPGTDSVSFTVQFPKGTSSFVCRVQNQYDKATDTVIQPVVR